MSLTDADRTLERYEKAKEVYAQVCLGMDCVMHLPKVGKSRNIGEIPFTNGQEAGIARCLLTLMQLKREFEHQYPGLRE